MSIYASNLHIENIVEDVISNAVGGVVIAIGIVDCFVASDFIFRYTPLGKSAKMLAAGSTIVTAGLVICVFVYFLVEVFFDPLPAQLEVNTSQTTQGAFWTTAGKTKAAHFNLIDGNLRSGMLSWIVPEGDLDVRWVAPKSAKKYRVSVSLYTGCTDADGATKVKSRAPAVTMGNVNRLEVRFDKGMETLSLPNLHSIYSLAKVAFSSDWPVQYWLVPETSKDIKVEEFLGGKPTLSYSSGEGRTTFFLSALTFASGGQTATPISRRLSIKMNGDSHTIVFAPSASIDPSTKSTCRAVDGAEVTSTHGTLTTNTLSVGALFQITPDSQGPEGYITDSGTVSGDGGAGWAVVDRMKHDDLYSLASVGRVSGFSFFGSARRFDLDGESVRLLPSDNVTAYGGDQLKVGPGVDGGLVASGSADYVWKNSSRLNQTRWEALDWPYRLFMVSVLGSTLSFLFLLAVRKLREDAHPECPW